MLRTLTTSPCMLMFVFSVSCFLKPASADNTMWWDKVAVDWHRVNCWPKPFNYADRAATRAPFAVMVSNGWRRQTTLGEHHFHWETERLTHAGKRQLRWILTKAPVERRSVYVEAGVTTDSTASRIDSVQQSVADVLPRGTLPAVIATDRGPASMPADLVDPIYRRFNATIADPRLPGGGGVGDGT